MIAYRGAYANVLSKSHDHYDEYDLRGFWSSGCVLEGATIADIRPTHGRMVTTTWQ